MPDFGIGEGLSALFGGDLLAGLFGGGAAEAGAAGLGAAEAGAAGAGAAAGAGTTLADIVGTGTGLFGGATGLEGTLLASGATGGLEGALGAGAGGALGALGTAESFLAAPEASGFVPSAIGGVSSFGDVPSLASSALPSNVANANAAVPGGSSVFNTGTSAVPGVNAAGAPSAIPAGGGASAISAPSGVTSAVDATATGVPGATGATSVGGAPLGAAPPTSLETLLGKAGGGVLDSLTKNPLGIALGAGGLGYNILQGQKETKNQQALTADAKTATANSDRLTASGEDLQKYLTNGTLPPAFQSQVDQAIQDAKTSAISNAASQGLSTDPTQNTALAATLAKIDASRPNMQAQVASQLFASGQGLVNAGQSAAGLSGQLFQALVQNDTTQAANTGKAIATLAAALSGRNQANAGGITISTGA